MSKTIKIQIIHALAMHSAKNETYQKGVVDKAVDQKLVAAAFHEQAGNEAYHEAMLGRYMFSQIEVLKTFFSDYLTGDGNLAEDATIDSTEADGITTILLSVSDRFNNGYVKTIARLSQKFVEDRMIYHWWLSVSKEFAAIYATAAEEDKATILNCFHKTAPAAPAYNFPTAIHVQYPLIPERNATPGYITPDNKDILQSVTIAGDSIVLTCSEPVDSCRVRYAINGIKKKSGYRSGSRGNLRDSQGDALAVTVKGKKYPLHNWSYQYDMAIKPDYKYEK